MNTSFGVASTGVLFYSAISEFNTDPFFPAEYGEVIDPNYVVEEIDWCLAHPNRKGEFHYHAASTCIANNHTYASRTYPMDADIKTVMM